MNTTKWASILIACVAAVSITTGCSSSAARKTVQIPTTQHTTNQIPSGHGISEVNPANYDEWSNWATSQVVPGMSQAAQLWGLDAIVVPQQGYLDQNFIGVAKFQQFCVVAFSTDGADTGSGHISMVILSRYNSYFTVTETDIPPKKLKVDLDSWSNVCNNQTPMPASSSSSTAA